MEERAMEVVFLHGFGGPHQAGRMMGLLLASATSNGFSAPERWKNPSWSASKGTWRSMG